MEGGGFHATYETWCLVCVGVGPLGERNTLPNEMKDGARKICCPRPYVTQLY